MCAGAAREPFVDAGSSADTHEAPESALRGTTDGIAWAFAVSLGTNIDGGICSGSEYPWPTV